MPSLSPCLDRTPPRSITHCAGCLDTTTLYVYSKRIARGSDESEEIVGVGKSEAHISVSVIRVNLVHPGILHIFGQIKDIYCLALDCFSASPRGIPFRNPSDVFSCTTIVRPIEPSNMYHTPPVTYREHRKKLRRGPVKV